MGRIWIPGGGGGVDLDVITAGADDVLAPKVIVGPDGEPLTGTLALSGNANTVDVRKGKTFYSNNAKSKLTGTMTELGAKTYSPGTANQVIAANQFLAGAQTMLGDADLVPENILYGKNIFNVAGNVRKYGAYIKNNVSITASAYYPPASATYYYTTITGFNFTPVVAIAYPVNWSNSLISSAVNLNGNLMVTGYNNKTTSFYYGGYGGLSYNSAKIGVSHNGSYNINIYGYY